MNEQLQHKSTTWQAATQALLLKQTAIKQPTIKAPTPKSLDTRAAPPHQHHQHPNNHHHYHIQRKRTRYQSNTTSENQFTCLG
jgi:hypothetical protein